MTPSVIIRCNKVPLHIFQFKYMYCFEMKRKQNWPISSNWQFWNLDVLGWLILPICPNSFISATIYAIFIDKDTQYFFRLMWYVPFLNLGQFLSRAKTQFPGSLMSGHWVKSQDLKTTCEERTKRKVPEAEHRGQRPWPTTTWIQG